MLSGCYKALMITLQALALLRPAVSAGRATPSLLRAFAAAAADGPKTATPPPDTARGATADLADVFIPGGCSGNSNSRSSVPHRRHALHVAA